jgi:hypothetical protein
VKDQPIIVASPSHLAMHLLVVRMRARRHIESTAELDVARERLMAGLAAWCQAHHVTLEWTETPGRRTKNREYRVAYHGDNFEAPDPNVYDAFDAEMRRLMLE